MFNALRAAPDEGSSDGLHRKWAPASEGMAYVLAMDLFQTSIANEACGPPLAQPTL